MFGNAKHSDCDLPTSFGTRIASQSLRPRETIMSTFGTGKWCERNRWSDIPRLDLDLHALVTKQVDAGAPVNPAPPVMPEDRSRADCHRMQ